MDPKPTLKIQNADGSLSAAYTLSDVARALGIRYRAAALRVHRGALPEPAVRVARSPYWTEEQLAEMCGSEGKEPAPMDS